jgi:hypothetical protein
MVLPRLVSKEQNTSCTMRACNKHGEGKILLITLNENETKRK